MQGEKELESYAERKSISIRIGETVVNAIDNMMTPPVQGETTEGFKKNVGRTTIACGALVVGGATMFVLDGVTGNGLNPFNYAVPINLYFNR